MIAWRLATALYPPLTGEGARKRGGRWSSPGVPLVYCSETLSLCVLEILVHLDSDDLPDNLMAWEVEFPDEAVERRADIPAAWLADPLQRQSRRFGDAWTAEQRSLALLVPSAIVLGERNVLLNPLHSRFAEVKILAQRAFALDPRLVRR